MLVSVVIPAYRAQETLVRAIESLRAQTYAQWECIVIADDMFDYQQWLASRELTDSRIRHAHTDIMRSGPYQARHIGFKAASGDIMACLDADDRVAPQWLERLVPVVAQCGAATDNPMVVDTQTNQMLYRAFQDITETLCIDLETFFKTTVPLFPLICRDKISRYFADISLSEDVITNAQLIDFMGKLTVVPETLYQYHIMPDSLSHHADAAMEYDKSYGLYIDRCLKGDGFGLSPAGQKIMAEGLANKRRLNQLFAVAQKENPALNFQTFVAARLYN